MLQLPKQTKKIRIIRHNYNLFKKLYNASILLIVIYMLSIVIEPKSQTYTYVLYGFSIASLYIIANIFYALIKYIDSFNLYGDLNLWGLRFLGGVFTFIGIIMLFNFDTVFNSIFLISYITIIVASFLLSAFCEFRSVRRYGIFIYRGN